MAPVEQPEDVEPGDKRAGAALYLALQPGA
jgi:hypothetical protein